MKKTAMMIYKWIVISVVLQLAILTFLNNVYLVKRGKVTPVLIETNGEPTISTKTSFKVPSGADQIKISFDGKYVSYISEGKIEIYDIKANKSKKTISPNNDIITCCEWLPDRNMIIYAMRAPDSEPGRVQLATYDITGDTEHKYPKIGNLLKKSEVVDVQLSPLTGVVYAKVKTGSTTATIYKFNRMDNLSYVMSANVNTLICGVNYSDQLVYQDSNNKLFVRDGTKNVSWPFPYKSKMALLGIDGEDKAYAGELDKNGKVTKINYGKLTLEPDKAWNRIVVKDAAVPQNIKVTRGGEVFEVLDGESSLLNLKDNKKYSFTGKLVEVMDGYAVTLNDGELKFVELK